jgi:hypothetical protein
MFRHFTLCFYGFPFVEIKDVLEGLGKPVRLSQELVKGKASFVEA